MERRFPASPKTPAAKQATPSTQKENLDTRSGLEVQQRERSGPAASGPASGLSAAVPNSLVVAVVAFICNQCNNKAHCQE